MYIKKIELLDFRNYESLELDLSDKTNILYGDNAQGKTNILEATYISGTTKSHKGSHDKEVIKFDKDEAHIKTIVCKNEKDFQIDIHLRKNKTKGIAINRIPVKRASDLFGLLNIIFFSPEDLNIIKLGPSERRRFMDIELCQLDKIYLSDLTNYNKVLNQRNKLLKDIIYNPSLKETLFVWDEKLVEYGKKIIKTRREFINELNIIVKNIHNNITGGRENIELEYDPDIEDYLFFDELMKKKDTDLRYAQTSVGPHRDDIKISVNGIDMRKFGSQGQQRTCALSMKLSEIKFVEDKIGEKPVLLLDDVFSELDHNRQNFLLESLENIQTIITCTGIDEFINTRLHIDKVYEVSNGTVALKSQE